MPDHPVTPAGTRIAVLTRSVGPLHGVGGLERHVADLLQHLLERDVEVTLVTRPGVAGPGTALPEHRRLHVMHVPYRTFPMAGRRGTTILDRSTAYPVFGYLAGRVALALAESGRVDLVYGHGASAAGYAVAHRRRPLDTPPFVFNPHGLEEFGGVDGTFGGRPAKRIAYAPLRAVVRACARAADRVIATDRVLEPVIGRCLDVDPDRIRLVPNAVDLRRMDALAGPADGDRARRELGVSPGETVLLSVGRIEHNKGFHVLADALATMTDVPWRWVLVGGGSGRDALERQIAAAGLAGRVHIVGPQLDAALHGWYEAATLFVHPTLYEGSSIATLEAMAHGRAVVATQAGGLPDKVRPGETGWLVPPGRPEPLAAALRAALAAPMRLPRLGAAGRALVESEFSWASATDRLMAVFGELLGPRQTAAAPAVAGTE